MPLFLRVPGSGSASTPSDTEDEAGGGARGSAARRRDPSPALALRSAALLRLAAACAALAVITLVALASGDGAALALRGRAVAARVRAVRTALGGGRLGAGRGNAPLAFATTDDELAPAPARAVAPPRAPREPPDDAGEGGRPDDAPPPAPLLEQPPARQPPAVDGDGSDRRLGAAAPVVDAPAAPAEVGAREAAAAAEAAAGAAAAAAAAEAAAAVDAGAAADAAAADFRPADPNTCEGYFGNGFSEEHVLLAGRAGGAPLLRCARHPATGAVLCDARRVRVFPSRVTVAAGGERVDAVLGRSEDAELPAFAPGALELADAGGWPGDAPSSSSAEGGGGGGVGGGEPLVLPDAFVVEVTHADPFKAALLRAARVVSAAPPAAVDCGEVVSEPTLFVTRVEYANLFHTTTDWYNVWAAARWAGLRAQRPSTAAARAGGAPAPPASPPPPPPRLPAHVVFLDGHAAGPMDDGWTALFASVSYVSALAARARAAGGPVCFARAILAPYGYNAAVSAGIAHRIADCRGSPYVRAFARDFVRALGLVPRAAAACGGAPAGGSGAGAPPPPPVPVLFVRRTHYLAHPRHSGQIVRRLENEDDIVAALAARAAADAAPPGAPAPAAAAAAAAAAPRGVALLNGELARMPLREQVAAAQAACLLVGAHGAGLSHVLFAPPGAAVLELQPPAFVRPHFIAYAFWAGAAHTVWPLDSTTPAAGAVVERVWLEAARAAERGAAGA